MVLEFDCIHAARLGLPHHFLRNLDVAQMVIASFCDYKAAFRWTYRASVDMNHIWHYSVLSLDAGKRSPYFEIRKFEVFRSINIQEIFPAGNHGYGLPPEKSVSR